MATITIYEATEIELAEPKFYLPGPDIGWAVGIYPDGSVRVTTRDRPFQIEKVEYYPLKNVTGHPEISEAEFYEIVSSNLAFRMNADAKMKQEWGLEIHQLHEHDADDRFDYLNEEYRREQGEADKGRESITPSNWEV